MGTWWTAWCGKAVFVRCAIGCGDVIVLWSSHSVALLGLREGRLLIRSRNASAGDDSVINVTAIDELLPNRIVWSRLMAFGQLSSHRTAAGGQSGELEKGSPRG